MKERIPLWQAIDGFFDYQDLYDMFVRELGNGDTIVEVGSYLGASACYLGEAILKAAKYIRVLCVDEWPALYRRDDGILVVQPYDTFCANVRQSGLCEVIIPLCCSSVKASRFVKNDLGAVFIDAGHDYASVKDDIKAWLPKVRKGGFLAGHDHSDTFPGVVQAVNELLPGHEHFGFQSWLQRI